jgi:hypothetical protein
VLPGVYADRSVPDSVSLRLFAALLYGGRGAKASHSTAAALYGVDAAADSRIHLSVPVSRCVRPQSGMVIHRSRRLSGSQVTTHRRFPTTAPARTLIDLADITPRPLLDALVADATRTGLVTVDYLRRQLHSLQGRRCTPFLRRLLDDFDPAMESVLEREYAHVVAVAGLPAGSSQYEIWDGPLLVARVDFAYPDRKLAIEIDGYAYHSTLQQFERDRRRQRALGAQGWQVQRFVADDVRGHPGDVVAELARLLDARPSTTVCKQMGQL